MKKILLSTVMFLGTAGLLFSQDEEYSQKFMERVRNTGHHADHAHAKGGHNHRECLTTLLKEGNQNIDKLNDEARKFLKGLADRPVISSELTRDTDHFRFHYTTTGIHSVPTADIAPANGTPDYVEFMMTTFENVYTEQITNLGYYFPPADGTDGGNSKYDVYIMDLEEDMGFPGLYGYVGGDEFVGNNPNSPLTEVAAYTSYMGMNTDYTWTGDVQMAIEVTAAHEFFHAIQYGITSDGSQNFFESTAAWMEDVVYPGADDNLQYLPSVFSNPDVSINAEDGDYWYGDWIFWKYIQEQYGENVIRDIWFRAIDEYENDAIANELIDQGTTFKNVFNDYVIANYVLSSNSNYDPYTYSRASVYQTYLNTRTPDQGVTIENTFTYSGSPVEHFSTSDGNSTLRPLSADYFEITAGQDFSVNLFKDDANANISLIFLQINTTTNTIDVEIPTPSGQNYYTSASQTGSYNKFVAIVARYFESGTYNSTTSKQYTLRILGPTSVKDATAEVSKIYPSPANEKFMVEYSASGASNLEVVDFTGKVVYNSYLEQGAQSTHVVNSSSLKNGIYFVFIKNDKGILAKEKIVITR